MALFDCPLIGVNLLPKGLDPAEVFSGGQFSMRNKEGFLRARERSLIQTIRPGAPRPCGWQRARAYLRHNLQRTRWPKAISEKNGTAPGQLSKTYNETTESTPLPAGKRAGNRSSPLLIQPPAQTMTSRRWLTIGPVQGCASTPYQEVSSSSKQDEVAAKES